MKKLLFLPLWLVFFSPLLIPGNSLFAQPCLDNDVCENAIEIPNVISGQSYVCINGCNLFATPESDSNNCLIDLYPTVWYKVTPDSSADVLNITVTSEDFLQPVIALYKTWLGCDNLSQVQIVGANASCVVGTFGQVEAIGTTLYNDATYYIAVSSYNSIGGNFSICVSTMDQSSICVLDRNIQIVNRSNGGPLEGPFDPRETVSICMNVNQYTAAGNGCQWFQGMVPVFGNGWDPSSFDSIGQPLNATINGFPTGQDGNGNYGTSTWMWTDSVGYHYDNPNLTIADLDGNGKIDMCNSLYEMDCPQVGVNGGSKGPCWDEDQGDLLPPGWFAYGINGTCPTPGPPIRVDWGDGNTCGLGMGPWQFCFDLVTRDVPDCMGDSTKRDLSLGFFTFADGEVGSWTGSASVCAKDHPVKLTLEAKCGRIAMGDVEPLPPMCTGDTLRYLIEEPNVTGWDWNISPFPFAPYTVNHGENGYLLEVPLVNTTGDVVEIKGVFIGSVQNSNDYIIRRFSFSLHNAESCITGVNSPGSNNAKKDIRIYPTPANESAILDWSFTLKQDAQVRIYDMHGSLVSTIPVSRHDGYQKQIDIHAFEPGVYLVSLSNSDIRSVAKLVKL